MGCIRALPKPLAPQPSPVLANSKLTMGVSLLVADMTQVYNGLLLGREEWIWHSQALKAFSQPPEERCPNGLS